MEPRGERWRDARSERDLSVKDAAAALSISPGYLRNIETDQPSARPSRRLVHRAVRLYGVPFRDLVRDSGDGVPDGNPSEEQEQETNVGPGREGGNKGRGAKDKKAPKRVRGAAA